MNSFTKKLMLSCTGVIFTSFLIVYFLFNVLVSNYIRDMAERELADGVQTAVYMSYFVPSQMRGPFQVELRESAIFANEDFAIGNVEFALEHEYTLHFAPAHEFRWYVESAIPQNFVIEGITGGHIFHPDRLIPITSLDIVEWREFDLITTDLDLTPIRINQMNIATMETRLAHGQVRVAHHGMPSLMNTNVIMMNANNEIISPLVYTLSYEGRAEVEFLVNYYLSNQATLVMDRMSMVSGVNSTYYLRAVRSFMRDGYGHVSILLYTDISSAVAFQNSMNRILGFLLFLSGLLSLGISIAMSTRFKRAIGKLCNYADAIGHGSWSQKAGVFRDTEFDRLSKSMDSMSDMLQSYESNQKQFFQNVSHELRTPLMSIQGYAEGILANIFCKDEAAGIILSEGQKMSNLVSELIYISRIDISGYNAHSIATLNIKNLLYGCVERVRPIAQKSNKQIFVSMPSYEITVVADEEKLDRAILNILSNAIRHAKSEVEIICKIEEDTLEIMVCDDGDGIDPADLPHIFKRFYKGENGNHGLGLAISKDIITSLNGKITAKNSNKSGAMFTVTLPMFTAR